MFEHDYQQEAINLLLPQFSESDNIKAILAGWLVNAKDWQKAANDIISAINIDVAEGVTLDFKGKLLNVPRLDRTDEEYRVAIKRQIIINRANGTMNNFIDLMSLILPPESRFDVIPTYPAAFRVIIHTPQDVVDESLIQAIAPIGVEGVFLNNPYQDKVVWYPSNVGTVSPPDEAILPNVADIGTTNKTLINVAYVTG